MAVVLRQCVGAWVFGGSFNTTPQELSAIGWFDLIGGFICGTKAATCGDRKFDFVVLSHVTRSQVRACGGRRRLQALQPGQAIATRKTKELTPQDDGTTDAVRHGPITRTSEQI